MPELLDNTNYITSLTGSDEHMVLRSGVPKRITHSNLSVAFGAGGTLPASVFFLSSALGTTGDAVLAQGSTTFGTDQTSAIQTILNTASATNPILIFWDGRYSVTGLLVKSYTTIIAFEGCGAILRNNASKAILSNYNSQPGTIADERITIVGGIWNGNGYQGATAMQTHSTAAYGFVVGIRMYGVRNVRLDNMTILNTRTYAVLFYTAENVVVDNMVIDQGVDPQFNQDGLDFDGYINNVRVNGLWARCGDDALALNSTMLKNNVDAGDYTLYFGHYGPITNVDLQNLYFKDSDMGIRLLTGNQLIDNISIRNLRGSCNYYWLIIDNYLQSPAGVDDAGPGNAGRVNISNVSVVTGTPANFVNWAKASINCNMDALVLENYTREDFSINDLPSFLIKGASTVVKSIVIRDYYSHDENAGNGNVTPHIYVDGATVHNLEVNGNVVREGSANNSPLVKNTGTIGALNVTGARMKNSNNLLDNTGTVSKVSACNIRHEGGTATFKTTTTVPKIVLSNYDGSTPLSGTFTTQKGDGFL